jgi:hypothetical protein
MPATERPTLNSDEAWSLVVQSARSLAGTVYESLVQHRHYRIIAVENARIVIERLDGDAQKETLSAGEIRSAIDRLNGANGVAKRGELFGNVAKEATLVRLHPQLVWSADGAFIEVTRDAALYSDEVDHPEIYIEGATKTVNVNRYERNPVARSKCIAHYGPNCRVCGINFSKKYGEIGAGFIHVHHLNPLAELNGAYEVDPIADLRPVCPNCHAMLHQRTPPFSIEELKEMVR